MNRQRVAVATLALFVGFGATACTEENSPIQGDGAPEIDAVAVNQAVLSYLADNEMAGATVAVTRAGRLVWSKGYGWADEGDQTRMQPWHRSRIGSTSKFITTIGLLHQLESAAGGGDLGSLTSGSSLQTLLSTKLYGHPGYDWDHDPSESVLLPGGDPDSPSWPHVTGETALADPELYWEALRAGVANYTPDQDDFDMDELITWASSIEIRHLLTHTSGHLRSGDQDAAKALFHPNGGELTYSELHQYMLMGTSWADEGSDDVQCFLDGELYVDPQDENYTGQDIPMPPLRYEPGTKRCYSNHAFGLVGMIIDEIAGPGDENTYRGVVEREILEPLGLFDVVPNNVDISDLDARPHGSTLDPGEPSNLGLATGGWSATAQDLARIMCGIDRDSNNLRLLDPATVSVMETIAFPDVDADQPLGWDSRSGDRLTKNGSIGGGNSRIAKFLPGYFGRTTDDEINVAFMVNDSTTEDTNVPGTGLLTTIAQAVADAAVPEDYDLFDPAYRCFVPEPEPEEPGVVAPVPTITEPLPPPPLVAPTDPPAPPAPPTVAIRQPTAGQKAAQRGVASILFSGFAREADGTAIPGTYYRWTATQGAATTSLCVGSDFDTGVAPTTIGGIAAVVDCTSFTRTLRNPVPGAGPPITIKLEAQGPAGTSGSATVVITLYTPPVR